VSHAVKILVDALLGHPPVEDPRGFRVAVDRPFLVGQLVLVGLRTQPVAEFADFRLAQVRARDRHIRGLPWVEPGGRRADGRRPDRRARSGSLSGRSLTVVRVRVRVDLVAGMAVSLSSGGVLRNF
jgi:hypothetical protein